MGDFVKGRDICRNFYLDIVSPALGTMEHDAILIGEGSDVLGYDQLVSIDHDWGIRLTVLIEKEQYIPFVREKILERLPESYRGITVRKDEEVSNIVVTTSSIWLLENLGIKDVNHLSASDWLSYPSNIYFNLPVECSLAEHWANITGQEVSYCGTQPMCGSG